MSQALNVIGALFDSDSPVAIDAWTKVMIYGEVLVYWPIAQPANPVVLIPYFVEIAHPGKTTCLYCG